ncbi:hypothetical protein A3K79_00845 [Candidatus Bathyarchaeota archaeon RBG_13_46_16b]|nr:MAG: hypothetical protein A3K79_00845 [Candidatus Bathyarchaeota archaeon RBG_13_46_16b]
MKKKQILLQARANTWWEKGIFQCLNPNQTQIEQVINRWLPGIYYTAERAISEARNIAVSETIS